MKGGLAKGGRWNGVVVAAAVAAACSSRIGRSGGRAESQVEEDTVTAVISVSIKRHLTSAPPLVLPSQFYFFLLLDYFLKYIYFLYSFCVCVDCLSLLSSWRRRRWWRQLIFSRDKDEEKIIINKTPISEPIAI